MLDKEQIVNWDFISQSEKDISICPECKVKYSRHQWSPAGKCPKCANGKETQ